MNRRGFIGAILAAAMAPAVVRADSLMRIVPRDALIIGGQGVLAGEDMLSFIREQTQFDIARDSLMMSFDIFDGRTQLGVMVEIAATEYPSQVGAVRRNAHTLLLREAASMGDFGCPIILPVGPKP